MASTTFRLSLTVLVIGGVVTTLVIQHHVRANLRQEIQSLHQAMAQIQAENESLSNRVARSKPTPTPHLPAPAVQLRVPAAESGEASEVTNLLARFPKLKDKAPNKLTASQLEAYLTSNGRNAASLLAAYRTTGDPALLGEATQKYTNDPQVALQAALRIDASPEERRRWLETLKQSDPVNALGNYLSALQYFKVGQTDQAVQELVAASGKLEYDDYIARRVRDDEQAYVASGYPAAEAKAIAPLQELLVLAASEEEAEAFAPLSRLRQLGQVKELCLAIVDLAKSYTKAGDPTSAQAALQMALDLGQRSSNTSGGDGLSRLVGSAAELIALRQLEPASLYGGDGQTVQDRMNQLKEQRTGMRDLYQQAVPLLGTMSDEDWIGYASRSRVFGEPSALQWVMGKYAQK